MFDNRRVSLAKRMDAGFMDYAGYGHEHQAAADSISKDLRQIVKNFWDQNMIDIHKPRQWAGVLRWVLNNDEDSVLDFPGVCYILGLDVEATRKWILETHVDWEKIASFKGLPGEGRGRPSATKVHIHEVCPVILLQRGDFNAAQGKKEGIPGKAGAQEGEEVNA